MNPKKPPTMSAPLRMPKELMARIKAVAAEMEMSDQEVMRLCLKVGLEHLKRIDYDLAKAVVDAAEKTKAAGMIIEPASARAGGRSTGSTRFQSSANESDERTGERLTDEPSGGYGAPRRKG
jgi:hypothetical protein